MTDSNTTPTTTPQSGASRLPALRIAAEIMQQAADTELLGTGVDVTSVDYRTPYSIGVLFTQLADHADCLPPDVLAWAITAAEAIVEAQGEDDEQQGVTRCRFCGCTEEHACPGGCAWAGDEQIRAAGLEPMDGDVCTACTTKAEAGILLTSSNA